MDKQLFDIGLCLYREANNSDKRKKLEENANLFMASRRSYDDFKLFMVTWFLPWMRSRNNKSAFYQLVEMDEFKELYCRINSSSTDAELNGCIDALVKIRGVGPVNASAIVTIIRPREYGIVNKYVVKALNKFENSNWDCSSLTVHTVKAIENQYSMLSYSLKSEMNRMVLPRELDMAYWGLGWSLNSGGFHLA